MSKTYGLGVFGEGTGIYRPLNKYAPTEDAVVNNAVKEVKKEYPSAMIVKTHGSGYQRSGLPDLYIVLGEGRSLWVEMKRPGADTTLLQKKKLELLWSLGIPCGTAESTETLLKVIKDVLS